MKLLFPTFFFFLIVIGDSTNVKELQRNHIVYYENGGKNYLTKLNFHLAPVGRYDDAPFSILFGKSILEYSFDWKIDPDIEQDDMMDKDKTIKERPEKYTIYFYEPDIGDTATFTHFFISKNHQILACNKDPQKMCKKDAWKEVPGMELSLISKVQIEYDFVARKISSYAVLKDGQKFLHSQLKIESSKGIFQLLFEREKYAPDNDNTINYWFSTLQLSFDPPPAFTFADNFQNEIVVDHTPRPLFDLLSSTTSSPSSPLSSTSSNNGHSITEETRTLQNHGITNPTEPKNGKPTSASLKLSSSTSESNSNNNLIYIIVGIVCALLLIIIIVIIVVICVCRKKKKKLNQPKPNPATSPPTKQHHPVVTNKTVKNKKKNTNDEPFNSVT